MKKLSYIILGFLIGAFATYYFCPRELEDDDDDMVEIVKPIRVITPAQAKILNDDWTKYRQTAVDSAARKQGRYRDTRSVWWSIEDIQNYLAYAENQSGELGYNMTGIRVYLGVYGKNAGQAKKDLSTMFIVPTGKKARSEASSLNLPIQPGNNNIPGIDPLNDGGGSDSPYRP